MWDNQDGGLIVVIALSAPHCQDVLTILMRSSFSQNHCQETIFPVWLGSFAPLLLIS